MSVFDLMKQGTLYWEHTFSHVGKLCQHLSQFLLTSRRNSTVGDETFQGIGNILRKLATSTKINSETSHDTVNNLTCHQYQPEAAVVHLIFENQPEVYIHS